MAGEPMIQKTWLTLMLIAALLAACGETEPHTVVVRHDAVEPDTVVPTLVQTESRHDAVVIPTVSPDVMRAREQLSHIGESAVLGLYIDHHFSMEEIIFGAEVIARVSYLRKQGSVALNTLTDATVGHWLARLEFRFRVHEYLKGTGPNEIGVFVYMDYDSEADARSALPALLAAHDGRWDNREAIIFANRTDPNGGIRDGFDIPVGSGQYWFSDVGNVERGFIDFYSVASRTEKHWLPEATAATSTTRGASTAAAAKRFLLDVPGSGSGGGARSSASLETITLSALKSRIGTLESEASAGGTQDYRLCVESAYRYRHRMQLRVSSSGDGVWSTVGYTIGSGLPAGTVLWEHDPRIGALPNKPGPMWFAGPDRDLFRYDNSNFRTVSHDPGVVRFTSRGVTARPLPAGIYWIYPNTQPEYSRLCATDRSIGHNKRLVIVTVEQSDAVPNLDHEAFFDPVAIGDAVGADGTNGVLKPTTFAHEGTPVTLSSLRWENGTVTLGLSPTTTMAGHAIDFVDTTGTTTLSLMFDDAVGGTTSTAWSVPTAPWADGDMLMMRIRELPPPNPVTVTLTPRPQGSNTFFNVTVSWDDPQTCDGQYFVYIGTESSLVRNMGFHASTVSTVTSSTGWLYSSVPDFWAVVRCDPSDYGASREVGRASLRAAAE